MSLSRSDVQELYTRSIDRYASFIGAFQSPQAMQALLQRSNLLHSGLRVLDAGCGFGMVTFALLKALREKNLDYEKIDAFDLTPAMLARFQSELQIRRIPRVQLQQADVLALDALPPSWTNYDLIVSASMLEYLPKQDLSRALAGLHARLAPHGQILVAAYFLLRIAARSLPHHIQFICSDDCVFAVPRAAPHAVARERNDHLGRAYPRLQQAR